MCSFKLEYYLRNMPSYFALDGVACTTKTTILKRLNAHQDLCVHYSDYKEMSDQFQFNTALSGMLYGMYRMRYDETSANEECINVYDRQPAAAVLYQCIFNDADDDELHKTFVDIKKLGLIDRYQSVVVLVEPEQASLVVDMMRKRNNGIDIMTDEYVLRQNHVFKTWARFNNYVTFTIDFKKDLCAQQDKLYKVILDVINFTK